jgi:hypothetical protein
MVMGTEKRMQPSLIHVPVLSDCHDTPKELARDMIGFFVPQGQCLDPCRGNGVFFDMLPPGADWCEIKQGRDFYAWRKQVRWIIGNPPYSHYSEWIRHSMTIAHDIVYVMPVYKIFASNKFQCELFGWGGIVHIRRYGTGTEWGFPFGHALGAVHYRKGYIGPTYWSKYERYT